ncbi:hypothetical protein BGW36DRAFT_381899 [Talaromyces proteolyticus]|uniref:Oxidoreductase n=1 Tax=Talaromyces proteolyticus TaxID=1131652 RepID=A0AAD4KLV8_9EURO|nr:uncharacterized protein BGW36DRAFT_381899 [Talaromyces proteolyticus]KAH8694995.1 hypothetical protein BGW36DRAFT_381899 [Talaromyces proteolyticus]
MSNAYAVIAGVGPGTGRSIATRFAKAYPVVLLARSGESYDSVVAEINNTGGQAIGIATDATDRSSLDAAFEKISKELFPGRYLAAAIYNVRPNGRPSLKPFLDLTLEELDSSLNGNIRGFFHFAQRVVPLLADAVKISNHPPTLIVTGATASTRGGARFGDIAAGKNGQRALTQTVAREFSPVGVHVAHIIIDGAIDIPGRENIYNHGPDSKISPDAIAESSWHLHTQPRSAFTHELDIRPYIGRF